MKPCTYLQALYLSFYSKAFYREVVRHWGGGAFLYLLFVLTLSWVLVIGTSIQPTINQELHQVLAQYIPQLPVITLEKGEAKTPQKKPYYIKNPDTQDLVGVIDTGGHTPWTADIQLFLLTQHQLYWRHSPRAFRIYEISPTLFVTLDPVQIKDQLKRWTPWLGVFLFPIFLVISYAFRVVQNLFYALIGKLLAVFARVRLRYSQIYLLGLVSLTPAILVGTVLDCFVVSFSQEWLIYVGLAIGYLFYGIWANRETTA